MVRKKKGAPAAIAETKANQEARATSLEQDRQGPPRQLTLSPESEPALLPKSSYDDIQRHIKEQNNLPADEDDDFPSESPYEPGEETKAKFRKLNQLWANEGYYINHPNNHRSLANAARVEQMIQKNNKLGKVVRQYKLFINDSKKRTMLLQYPNREASQEYRAKNKSKPLEIRIKPKSGVVEVDIPMDIHSNFDKEKGIQYGEAMRTSQLMQQGGSYGLAGGMGIEPSKSKNDRRAPPPETPLYERLLDNFEDSNNKGHVMNKITLGGRVVPFKDGEPIYMLATFKGDTCTFTKLDCMVQLRPQFTHVDALKEQGKSWFRSQRNDDEKEEETSNENKVKAVNMAVKSTENTEESDMYGGMSETAKILRFIRDEPFQHLAWIDQDEGESFQVYEETLVYQNLEDAPQLVSEMTNEQYLDAISCPRVDPIKQGKKILGEGGASNAGSRADDDQEDEGEDESENNEEDNANLEPLPKGVVYPDDGTVELLVETACRKICCHPEKAEGRWESILKQKASSMPNWAFLFPDHRHHLFYKWRLAENRAGRGIPPNEDGKFFGA